METGNRQGEGEGEEEGGREGGPGGPQGTRGNYPASESTPHGHCILYRDSVPSAYPYIRSQLSGVRS